MHDQARKFVERVKALYPTHFIRKRVLECGSLNINGGVRDLFQGCMYTGVDVVPGDGVEMVSKVHELEYEDAHFDVIVSTEMLEHDMHWRASLDAMERMLKPGGLLILTCAAPGRVRHGTRDAHPEASGTSRLDDTDWADYFRPLAESDIAGTLDMDRYGEKELTVNGTDLYFYGLRRGELESASCMAAEYGR